jgi:hypothetical protein
MLNTKAFTPLIGSGVVLTSTGSTARVAIGGGTRVDNNETVRIYNEGPDDVALKPGDGAVEAVATGADLHIPAGGVEVFTLLASWTHIAGVSVIASTGTAGGSARVHIIRGAGT